MLKLLNFILLLSFMPQLAHLTQAEVCNLSLKKALKYLNYENGREIQKNKGKEMI